ncbi:FadR family transcriptional regulator [Devosia sp. MC532]|uniref:FadR/GntR family transcriptional regulator n=1 Tax=Devosia sp. MC532 TaxID=2799788 RepID=UPI0018F6B6A3|nr:FadR/GntR family transcriptional regulator [Devosia sp. MC532]MBJ7579132.1 FadR family transcriptional regulator [Devosia sp. MC532]
MKLQAVSNRKLYIQIADQIRDQIAAGAVAPGVQLPSERDLAQSLGVSRPTVREALIALEVAGLVEVRVGVGAFVKGPLARETDLPEQSASPVEIMAVRRLLEPEAAALASQGISSTGRERLKQTLIRMGEETASGQWSSDSDRTLHMTLAEASGNSVLRETLEGLWASRTGAVDEQFHRHLGDIDAVRAHILSDHVSIADAVLAGNADAARAAMTAHLDYVAQAMTDVWD